METTLRQRARLEPEGLASAGVWLRHACHQVSTLGGSRRYLLQGYAASNVDTQASAAPIPLTALTERRRPDPSAYQADAATRRIRRLQRELNAFGIERRGSGIKLRWLFAAMTGLVLLLVLLWQP